MDKNIITFYPVDNGDCILLEMKNGLKMMWDCKFRNSVENSDDESKFDVINNLLNYKLEKKVSKLPFIDAFVLSHPDQDHCLGFNNKFYLGDPIKISQKDIDAQKILIGELWYSPRVFIEHTDELCDDAIAFKKEADRRMRLFKEDPVRANQDGNRIRIVGWADLDNLVGLEKRITIPGSEINEVNGHNYNDFRIFIHSPFRNAIENNDRNETSIVMQFRFDWNSIKDVANLILGGDAEWRVWEKIVKLSDVKTLKWDLFEAPHHCSWSFFADDRENDKPNKSSLDFLAKRNSKAIIVSSSKYISHKDSNPPCKKAKNRYVKEIGENNFYCTGGDCIDGTPSPLAFEVTNSGFKKIEHKIDDSQAHDYADAFINGKLKLGATGLNLSLGNSIAKSGGFYGKE